MEVRREQYIHMNIAFLRLFYKQKRHETDFFAKTGSGQTQGKVEEKEACTFLQASTLA
jgi:hypothetical protein